MYQFTHFIRTSVQIVGASISLTLLVTVVLVVGWHVHGGSLLSVQTDSMKQVVRAGDAVIVSPSAPETLRVGDIVNFQSSIDPKTTVTHRIIAVDYHDKRVTTKGDNLSTADPPMSIHAVNGRVRWFAPGLGKVLDELQHPLRIVVGCYVLLSLLLVIELRQFLRSYGHHYSAAG